MRERPEALNKIGMALSGETNLNGLLQLIVREARHFTEADAGSLRVVDQDYICIHFEVPQNDTLKERALPKPETFKPYSIPITRDRYRQIRSNKTRNPEYP